jgi:predicted PurR-regulated permease PerM
MQREPSTPRRISSRDVWVVIVNVFAALVVFLLLWRLRALVSWIFVAILIALAAEPAVAFLTRHRIKRGLAVLSIFSVAFAVIATLLGTVVPLLVEQGRALIARAPELLDRVQHLGFVQWLDVRVDLLDRVEHELATRAAAGPALAVAGTVLHGLFAIVTTLALSVFMLLNGGTLVRKGLSFVNPASRPHWEHVTQKMKSVVGGYLVGSVVVSSIGGFVMGVTTLSLGVPYFLALGLVMVILGLIPFLGSIIGAVLVVGVTFATVGLRSGLIALGVYLVYQQVENHILHPVVQRRTINMNPLLVALSLLAGGILGGVIGVLLALPFAGVVQVLIVDALERRRERWSDDNLVQP